MNLILNAFAFKEDYGSSMQLNNRSDDAKLRTYMKNMVVSLVSCKLKNPCDTVCLATTSEPASPYKEMLEKAGVVIRIIPFDKFLMPKDFPWSLAFYKLCVLDTLIKEGGFENLLLMDTDTITMDSFEDLWQEAAHGLMLYPVNHTYSHKDRMIIKEAYNSLYPDGKDNMVHYGGEFICGNREALSQLMEYCSSIYEDVKKSEFNIPKNSGDEVILSMAAALYVKKAPVITAGAYIFRYWTENGFYLVATNTVSNPVCVWHMPAEKDTGVILLYNYYCKHGVFPEREKAASMLGIVSAKRPFGLYHIMARFNRKYNK